MARRKNTKFGRWRVTRYGIETGYPYPYAIPKRDLGRVRDGVYSDWVLHLAVKHGRWCRIDDFIRAWKHAVEYHGTDVSQIDLDLTIAEMHRLWARRANRATLEVDRQPEIQRQ